jgi:SAM-dependent methyltransferase
MPGLEHAATVARVRERRLTFGKVAELYDRARPSYPDALVEDLIELTGADRALEVGAGTGKATVLFARRGLSVLALEPSAEMVQVARRNCASFSEVRIEQVEFERWEPRGERFPLLYSAQAWHWVAPEHRYSRARAALQDGGLLAPFWNRIEWERCELLGPLRDAYDRGGAGPAEEDPMDPRAPGTVGQRDWWTREVEGASGFGDPEVRAYRWTQQYSADEYVALLRTHSSQLVLEPARREALLGCVADAIATRGDGVLRIPYATQLCLARATPRP